MRYSDSSCRNVEYLIDGRNRRVGRKLNGTLAARWIYQSGLSPVAELDASGNITKRFVYASRGHAPDLMVAGDSTYRLITDHLGSVRLVVNAATGAVRQQLAYDAWGNVTLDTNPGFQPLGYAGGLTDTTTRLVRFGARDYEPATGRWTAKDPIGFDSGEANAWTYSADSPMNGVDPTGLSAADAEAILRAFNETSSRMTQAGQRRSPAVLNNIMRTIYIISRGGYGRPYLGCGEQATVLQDELYKRKYDDNWAFEINGSGLPQWQPGFGLTGNHWWVTAKSSNPDDPVLILDPWRSDFRRR